MTEGGFQETDLVIQTDKMVPADVQSRSQAGSEVREHENDLCIDNVEVVRDIGYSQR